MLSDESRKARALLATAAAQARRAGHSDEAEAVVAVRRRDYRYHAARDYIREVVDAAPPLTDEQCRSLARILADGGRG